MVTFRKYENVERNAVVRVSVQEVVASIVTWQMERDACSSSSNKNALVCKLLK